MPNLLWDKGFKKSYKKRIKNNKSVKNDFWETIEIFINDAFDNRLRTHKLSGKFEGLWAFSINYDLRVIFKFLDNDEILLIDIGSHEEVY